MACITERPLYLCVNDIDLALNLHRLQFSDYTQQNWINIVHAMKANKEGRTIILSIKNPVSLYTVNLMDKIIERHGKDMRFDILSAYSKQVEMPKHHRPSTVGVIKLTHISGGMWKLSFKRWNLKGVVKTWCTSIPSVHLMQYLAKEVYKKNSVVGIGAFLDATIPFVKTANA